MDTLIAIATAVGILKGQAAQPPRPPAKLPEAATVARPETKTEISQRHKAEWPLDY